MEQHTFVRQGGEINFPESLQEEDDRPIPESPFPTSPLSIFGRGSLTSEKEEEDVCNVIRRSKSVRASKNTQLVN